MTMNSIFNGITLTINIIVLRGISMQSHSFFKVLFLRFCSKKKKKGEKNDLHLFLFKKSWINRSRIGQEILKLDYVSVH